MALFREVPHINVSSSTAVLSYTITCSSQSQLAHLFILWYENSCNPKCLSRKVQM